MFDSLGFSVYLSSFAQQQAALEAAAGQGALVFLSLHISEEFSSDYPQRAKEICQWLTHRQFRIIADVSTKTVEQFAQPDLVALAKHLGIWALRIDYGFSEDEIETLAAQMPIVLNASTVGEEAKRLAQAGPLVMAMHNFYPRPETGLDEEFFAQTTQRLQKAGLKVLAFIPGDSHLRGPLHLGLPTLECHRGLPPSVCCAQLKRKFRVDGVFVGDPGISVKEQQRIQRLNGEGVLELPVRLNPGYESLYDRVFTCRADSPSWLIRFAESRIYSCFGKSVPPEECIPRVRGSITIDNERYGRYSGEIQLLRQDFPQDDRVNVIGAMCEEYSLLMDMVENGSSFMLVRP